MLFKPHLVQVISPVEGLEFLFAGDSFFNNHFFRLHFATSGLASETNHVQGLVSSIEACLDKPEGWS